MRRPIIAGNWKMNTSLEEAIALVDGLMQQPNLSEASESVEAVVAPPFPWIVPIQQRLRAAASGIQVAAQDCAAEDQGAFTGEVSAKMVAPYCTYIIVGHSERRHVLNENDDLVAAKFRAVQRNGLIPILCVGELLSEREHGDANRVVERQLRSALESSSGQNSTRLVIAYEPVWAIGTGRAATPDDAQEMAVHIRSVLGGRFSTEIAEGIRIQYGGSVNAANARAILELPDIDGALVGGASLRADEFSAIIANVPSAT